MLSDLCLIRIVSTSLGFRELSSSRDIRVVVGRLNWLERELVVFVFEPADPIFSVRWDSWCGGLITIEVISRSFFGLEMYGSWDGNFGSTLIFLVAQSCSWYGLWSLTSDWFLGRLRASIWCAARSLSFILNDLLNFVTWVLSSWICLLDWWTRITACHPLCEYVPKKSVDRGL